MTSFYTKHANGRTDGRDNMEAGREKDNTVCQKLTQSGQTRPSIHGSDWSQLSAGNIQEAASHVHQLALQAFKLTQRA